MRKAVGWAYVHKFTAAAAVVTLYAVLSGAGVVSVAFWAFVTVALSRWEGEDSV